MQRLPNQLLCVELSTSNQTYTTPDKTKTTISAATVTNKTATARHLTVTVTPNGATARNLVYQKVIPANTEMTLNALIGHTFGSSASGSTAILTVVAEANSALDLVVSGYETVGT